MKAKNLIGLGNHNERKTKSHSNPDIDTSKSEYNFDLVSGRTKTIKKDIEDYIENNKFTKKSIRKDAVLVNEWIISSDRDFFKSLDKSEKINFFESAKEYFSDRFGEDNIRYAIVHLDETTPHMHMGIVPFDGEKKLSAKRVFNRQALIDIQKELPEFLQSKGFDIERGIEGSERLHLDTPEFKATMAKLKEIERSISDLEAQKRLLEADKDLLQEKLFVIKENLPEVKFKAKKVSEFKKIPFTNNVVVDSDYLHRLTQRDNLRDINNLLANKLKKQLEREDSSVKKIQSLRSETSEMNLEAQKRLEGAFSVEAEAQDRYDKQIHLNKRYEALEADFKRARAELWGLEQENNNLKDIVKELESNNNSLNRVLVESIQSMNTLAFDELNTSQINLLNAIRLKSARILKKIDPESVEELSNARVSKDIQKSIKKTKGLER